MKTSYFLFSILLFSINTVITAQSKNYIGFGSSFDLSKTIVTNDNSEGLLPSTTNFNTIGLHAFINLNSDKLFQLRINSRINAKTIEFSSDELIDFGSVLIDRYNSQFVSLDLGLTGLIAIPIKESKLMPAFGVFGSSNFTTRGFGAGREDGTLTALEVLSEFPQRTNKPFVNYLGFNAGLIYQTAINGHTIEFYGMVYFSGNDSFVATYEHENVDNLIYKGSYQALTFGVNIPFTLKRKEG